MKQSTIFILVPLIFMPIFWMVANAASQGPEYPPKETPIHPAETEDISAVEDAIYQKIDQERQNSIYFWNQNITVENTRISFDGQWAASIMVPINSETGQPPETEPALVITIQIEGEWHPLFPNDPEYLRAIESAPEELLSAEHKEVLIQMNLDKAVNMPAAAIGGYLLPWEAGTSYYLTGSTCHDEYIPSGNSHYAFDFAYNRTMWDILAAKSAEVWLWKDDVPTCYEWSCWKDQPVGNYIVLRDASTNPVTYQLYLHLKQDSIPDEIKVKGFQVAQGQFIGIVDNTGQSSGSHLHFQVQVPLYGDNHYWGRSVDITFNDVSINGGRPRIQNKNYCMDFNFCDKPGDVCNTSQIYYTSQNQRVYPEDSTPPMGDILNPLIGETYTASLPLEGWAEDLGDRDSTASGLHSAQFMAFYNGGWNDIGPAFDSVIFAYNWDWCTSDVPDGPVSLALRLTDNRGNQTPGLPGLRHITKQYSCPPYPPLPTCQPTKDQVAIFSEINFQGECQILNSGGYTDNASLGPVGDNTAQSILVGTNVQAEIFTESNYQGRKEILQVNDSNLSDNLIASNTLSSIKVSTKSFSQVDTPSLDLTKLTSTEREVFSSITAFTAPYSDTMEGDTSSWNTTGLWHLSQTHSKSAKNSWRYGLEDNINSYNGTKNSGILESPIITLPVSTDPYMLQFWYRYQTESRFKHWDQRWVQIAIDGGEFINVYQLNDDPMLGWLRARIDLLPYISMNNEHTIQVRFFFDTIDNYNNDFEGWFIDDLQIKVEPVSVCSDDLYEPNDHRENAKKLSYGKTANATICPGWDLDYYRFEGYAGDRVVIDIDAKSNGSDLDGYLFLLDNDSRSELAENDDEILYEKQDPLLGYLLPRDGEYYLKVKAWDHPMGNGEYSLSLLKDDQNPMIQLINPIENSSIPIGNVTLKVQATDVLSGIDFVRFSYHDSNWETGKWIEVGTDYDGSDGWSVVLDTSSMTNGDTISIYAMAYDRGGNWGHDAAWSVNVDGTPFKTKLVNLANPAQSTALHLQWSVTGAGVKTAIVNLQQKMNGSWIDLLTNTDLTEYWFIGKSGNNYTFQVSAQDYAGNTSSALTDTAIPVASSLCSQPDTWDNASKNDNSHIRATPIMINQAPQSHNFCNPAEANYLNDQDWLSFTAEKGQLYILTAIPQGDRSAAVTIRLYAEDSTTKLAEKSATTFGKNTVLYWRAVESGQVYIQLQHNDGNVAGNGTAYKFHLSDGSVYMPMINK